MDWNTRSRTVTERVDPDRVAALHATLGLGGPPPGIGAPLPPFWHYVQFWEARPVAELGPDGHPKTGDFIPDLGLPRRMWAGGQLQFYTPILIGSELTKTTRITDVARKDGASGPLGVVTLQHELHQDGTLCVAEDQRLIYRAAPSPNDPAPQTRAAPTDETLCRKRRFSTTDLFRYSALTFNGHRIHYDRNYAVESEGYPGLIVHGPLLAQLLIDLAQSLLGPLKTFEFRATAPLFDHEDASFCAKPGESDLNLWVRGPDGRLCMSATAT